VTICDQNCFLGYFVAIAYNPKNINPRFEHTYGDQLLQNENCTVLSHRRPLHGDGANMSLRARAKRARNPIKKERDVPFGKDDFKRPFTRLQDI
jgi:hypothetical protein